MDSSARINPGDTVDYSLKCTGRSYRGKVLRILSVHSAVVEIRNTKGKVHNKVILLAKLKKVTNNILDHYGMVQ